jgi:hypothetical protein
MFAALECMAANQATAHATAASSATKTTPNTPPNSRPAPNARTRQPPNESAGAVIRLAITFDIPAKLTTWHAISSST